MSDSKPQRPEKSFRAGGVSSAVWRHDRQQDGRTVTNYSATFSKRFFDKTTQQWRDSDTFFPEDLPRLILVSQKAYEYIVLREQDNTDVDFDPAALEGANEA